MLTRVGWTLKRVSVYSYAKKVIGLPQVPKIISNALSNASNRKHTVKCIKYTTFILVKQAANIFDCQLKRIMRLTKANNIRKKITEFIRSWLNGIDNKKNMNVIARSRALFSFRSMHVALYRTFAAYEYVIKFIAHTKNKYLRHSLAWPISCRI